MPQVKRCQWVLGGNVLYTDYHDSEWGVPQHDDRVLFEFLILEGAQAGLSWSTILNKREHFQRAFEGWDPVRIAAYTEPDFERLLADPGIVRNRLKVYGAAKNANAFLALQAEAGSFDAWLWNWVDGTPQRRPGYWKPESIPSSTPLSDAISKDLKKRGFTFVGTTIVYASDHEPYWWPGQAPRAVWTPVHPGDARHLTFLEGADVLIHDAQYLDREYPAKRGWGHSTVNYVTDLATQAGVKQVILFHHDPTHDDRLVAAMARAAVRRAAGHDNPLQVLAAAEGMEIVLAERPDVPIQPSAAPTVCPASDDPPPRGRIGTP